MFVRRARISFVPVSLLIFGLGVLMWLPMTVAMSAVLLLMGISIPAVLFWKGRSAGSNERTDP
jgi:hypothetical protein